MAGVDILSTERVVSETAFNWGLFWLVASIFIALIIGLLAVSIFTQDFAPAMVVGILAIPIGAMISWGVGSTNAEPIAYKTQYKVTISDEVKMNEFYEKYEVIDQEGKIYTVEERED